LCISQAESARGLMSDMFQPDSLIIPLVSWPDRMSAHFLNEGAEADYMLHRFLRAIRHHPTLHRQRSRVKRRINYWLSLHQPRIPTLPKYLTTSEHKIHNDHSKDASNIHRRKITHLSYQPHNNDRTLSRRLEVRSPHPPCHPIPHSLTHPAKHTSTTPPGHLTPATTTAKQCPWASSSALYHSTFSFTSYRPLPPANCS
jgi:hypothetical protein